MFYLISAYWFWMLLALVLGVIVGWLIYDRRMGWSRIALGLFLVGLAVALLKLLPGAWGLWLETALLLFGSYFAGGIFGAWLRGQTLAKSAVPLASAAGAAVFATESGAPALRSQIYPGSKPMALSGAPVGGGDDLTLIKGVGPANKAILQGLGVYQFQQIAGWTGEECNWVGHKIAFPGRVEREHWVDQAKLLATGSDTEFSKGVKSGAIKMDASANAPMGEADISQIAADVKARRMAADAIIRQAADDKQAAAKAIADTAAKQAVDKAAADVAVKHAADKAAADAAAKQAADNAAAGAAAKTAASQPGARPAALAAATNGQGDDLKLIKGIGPKNEAILHSLGIWHFSQIADWKAPEQAWVGYHMAFPGRVEREIWVEQARLLGAGMDTEHSLGVKSGLIAMDARSDAPLSAEEGARLKSALPEVAAAVADESKFDGKRPLGLARPRGGKGDDLKRIKGIGPQNEGRLQGLGIWHFDQIAAWNRDQVQWVGGYLAFPGRIDRENWISQAKILATGAAPGL